MKYYFAAFIPENEGGYSVLSPDFTEVNTQGDTLKECMEMAMDAFHIIVEEYAKEGREIPEPSDIKAAQEKIDKRLEHLGFEPQEGTLFQLIPVATPNFAISSICVSLSKFDLDEIDYKAKLYGMKRSKFLVAAARAYHQ